MKLETRTLSAPAKGRKGDKALEIQVCVPENEADRLELCDGSEERLNRIVLADYVVKLQADLRPDMTADGSNDAEIIERAKTWRYTGERSGGARGPSANTLVSKLAASGKKTFTLADMQKAIEDAQAKK